MATTYSGPARLLLDGEFVSGMASLSTHQRGGVSGWGGSFRPDKVPAEVNEGGEEIQLELPYDREGTVTVTGKRRLLATQVLISLAGRGPVPF